MKKPGFSVARKRLISAILLTIALPPLGLLATILSIDGGMSGPALFMLTPLFAFGAFLLAIAAWRGFPTSRAARAGSFCICFIALSAGVLATFFIVSNGAEFPVQALAPGKTTAPYRQTRVILRSHGGDFIILDPANRLQFRYGALPASVEVHDGWRTVIFDQPVHLKSWTDCIAMDEKDVLFGGWQEVCPAAAEGSVVVTPEGRITERGGP